MDQGRMDKDRVDGIGKKVSGSVKQAIGKVTGDATDKLPPKV